MRIIDLILEMGRKKFDHSGDCFDSAFDLMFDNIFRKNIKNLKLVHGIVSGQGKVSGYRFTHAWCEDDENVYDNSNNRTITIPKIIYYSIGNINPEQCKYYDEKQFREMVNKFKNKGPWEIENKSYEEKFDPKTRRYN